MTKDGSDVVVTPSGSVRASRALRWSVAVVAVAYVGYLALLVTCDLRRVAPLGFIPVFEPGRWSADCRQSRSAHAPACVQATGSNERTVRCWKGAGTGSAFACNWTRRTARPRNRARRSLVDRPPDALGRAGEWRSGPARPGLLGLPAGPGHHARLRARGRLQALLAAIGAVRRVLLASFGHGVARAADAHVLPSGMPCRSLSRLSSGCRTRRASRSGRCCLRSSRCFRAAVLAHPTCRGALPGGAHRRLARVRVASPDAGSRAAIGTAGSDAVACSPSALSTPACGRTAAGAQAGGSTR